jgi:hypothetical protein
MNSLPGFKCSKRVVRILVARLSIRLLCPLSQI